MGCCRFICSTTAALHLARWTTCRSAVHAYGGGRNTAKPAAAARGPFRCTHSGGNSSSTGHDSCACAASSRQPPQSLQFWASQCHAPECHASACCCWHLHLGGTIGCVAAWRTKLGQPMAKWQCSRASAWLPTTSSSLAHGPS